MKIKVNSTNLARELVRVNSIFPVKDHHLLLRTNGEQLEIIGTSSHGQVRALVPLMEMEEIGEIAATFNLFSVLSSIKSDEIDILSKNNRITVSSDTYAMSFSQDVDPELLSNSMEVPENFPDTNLLGLRKIAYAHGKSSQGTGRDVVWFIPGWAICGDGIKFAAFPVQNEERFIIAVDPIKKIRFKDKLNFTKNGDYIWLKDNSILYGTTTVGDNPPTLLDTLMDLQVAGAGRAIIKPGDCIPKINLLQKIEASANQPAVANLQIRDGGLYLKSKTLSTTEGDFFIAASEIISEGEVDVNPQELYRILINLSKNGSVVVGFTVFEETNLSLLTFIDQEVRHYLMPVATK